MSFPNLAAPPRPLIHKRSFSESSLALHPVPSLPDSPIALRTDNTLPNDRTHCRSRSTSDTIKETTTHERYPQYDVPGPLDNFKPFDMRNTSARALHDVPEGTVASLAPVTTAALRLRVDSAASGANNLPLQAPLYPEGKPNTASVSKVPTAIAQGTPFSTVLPKSCSITRKAPLKIAPPTSRIGLGGTMASSTPVTSPTSQTDTLRQETPYTPISIKSPQGIFAPHHRKNSLRSETQEGAASTPPQTPAHLRNVSGASIRMANRLPNIRDVETEEGVEMLRKNSITIPRPLFSPFDFGQSMTVSLEERFGDGHSMMCSPEETI